MTRAVPMSPRACRCCESVADLWRWAHQGGYQAGHAAGYEAAVRDFWRGACEGLAALDESSSLALVSALSSPTDDDVANGAWALATVLRRRATRLRAWAKEGA